MKKIFSIISAVIITAVAVLIGVMAGVKKNIGFTINKPKYINVFYKSTVTKNKGESFQEYFEDEEGKKPAACYEEYNELVTLINKMTELSLLQLAQNNKDLNYKIEYNKQDYAVYDSKLKEQNLAIELIYDIEQNVVVYDGENARVIPYYGIIFIIPLSNKFEEVVCYTSPTNAPNQIDEQYENCTPIILKGVAKKLIKYVESLE